MVKKNTIFTREDYDRMLDNMLGMPGQTQNKPIGIISGLRAAAQRLGYPKLPTRLPKV